MQTWRTEHQRALENKTWLWPIDLFILELGCRECFVNVIPVGSGLDLRSQDMFAVTMDQEVMSFMAVCSRNETLERYHYQRN